MDSADSLLGDFASGDGAAPAGEVLRPVPAMKRDQDSTDDFEHLDRENKQEAGESPQHQHRTASQSFLDMERDSFVLPPRAPSGGLEQADHLADKFTDSESDADTAGESPLHRPAPLAAESRNPHSLTAPQPQPAATPITVEKSTPEVEAKSSPTPEPKLPEPLKPDTAVPQSTSEPAAHLKPQPQVPKPALAEPKPTPAEPKTTPVESKPIPAEPKSMPAEPKPTPAELKPDVSRAPTAHVIEAEVIFCQMGLDAWFDPQRLHPEVEALIYWRCAARSGAALGAGLALLVALACCSVVSVLAYAALLTLSAAVAFRVYRNVMQAVQKTNEGHPFKWLLEKDISVPAERAQSLAAAATAHLNAALSELRRLFLAEDLVDSLKFGVLLWCLTYVGACFNGITLIILGWVALFTLPKAYEMNKAQVDANLELARDKINQISARVRAAVPLGRKAESDKDK